jgi:hypothetical protein
MFLLEKVGLEPDQRLAAKQECVVPTKFFSKPLWPAQSSEKHFFSTEFLLLLMM